MHRCLLPTDTFLLQRPSTIFPLFSSPPTPHEFRLFQELTYLPPYHPRRQFHCLSNAKFALVGFFATNVIFAGKRSSRHADAPEGELRTYNLLNGELYRMV